MGKKENHSCVALCAPGESPGRINAFHGHGDATVAKLALTKLSPRLRPNWLAKSRSYRAEASLDAVGAFEKLQQQTEAQRGYSRVPRAEV